MTGYKVFDENLQCRGMQFEVGKTYKTGAKKEEMSLCSNTVIHFCRELHRIETESKCKISESRVCEIIASGDIIDDGSKFGTNEITILRELTKEEKEKFNNTNTGNWNTGYRNTGDTNTGNWNTGYRNTGDWNTGDRNTGGWNTGNRNTGNRNAGDWNTGDWNTGDWNTGDWNTGYFNTNEPTIRIFNKTTKKSRDNINFPDFLYFSLTVWVSYDTATDEEKQAHKKEIEACGGFLKKLEYKQAFRLAWDKADKADHKKLLNLPNWNNDIFKEISGIDAEAEIAKENA